MKETTFQFRISENLKTKLEKQALKEGVSVSRLVLLAIAARYPKLLDDILKN